MDNNNGKTMKSLDDLIYINSESKQSIEIKQGVWQGETISGGTYIPNDSPHAYQVFKRLELASINRRAIIESLYFISGAINTEHYLELTKEIEVNLNQLKEHYKFKSVSLLLVNANDIEKVQVKLFEDIHLCDFFLKTQFGFSAEDVIANKLPQPFNGTRIFEQEWHTSQESILRKYPKPQNLGGSNNIVGQI